jgi:hypothetical protein
MRGSFLLNQCCTLVQIRFGLKVSVIVSSSLVSVQIGSNSQSLHSPHLSEELRSVNRGGSLNCSTSIPLLTNEN